MHEEIKMVPGKSVTLVLPSGAQINVEVTADTASVTKNYQCYRPEEVTVLFSEELDLENPGEIWIETWPHDERIQIEQQLDGYEMDELMGDTEGMPTKNCNLGEMFYCPVCKGGKKCIKVNKANMRSFDPTETYGLECGHTVIGNEKPPYPPEE